MKSPRNYEVEVKLRVCNRASLLHRLREFGAREMSCVHEQNTLYDTPQRDLGSGGHLLRLRLVTPVRAGWSRRRNRGTAVPGLLTFKSPAGGPSRYKVREEHELPVRDAGQAAQILHAIGLRPWFRYEKYRTRYRLPNVQNLHLDLDETPIGLFLELEGSRASIDRAARALGYGPPDYITASYSQLYLKLSGRR